MSRTRPCNPVITPLQVKEDLLLARTSQQVFGRVVKKKKKVKEDQIDGVDVRLSKTAPSERSYAGIPSFKLTYGDELAQSNYVKRALASKLEELKTLKENAIHSVGPEVNHLRIVLQMPNVQRALHKLALTIQNYCRHRAFHVWKHAYNVVKIYERLAKGKKMRAAEKLHRAWRRYVVRRDEAERQRILREQLRRRSMRAVSQIEKKYMRFREHKRRQLQTTAEVKIRQCTAAVRIQKVYRGWAARAWRANEMRCRLMRNLRIWAKGNIQKLLDRPGLQDVQTIHMLMKSIAIATTPSRPMRELPRLYVTKTCIQWAKRREAEEEKQAASLRAEYVQMVKERRLMRENDLHDEFRRHYAAVLAELRRQQNEVQKLREEREREEERVRKVREQTRNIIESVRAEEVLERAEREDMFREEYQQRDIEAAVAVAKSRNYLTDCVMMEHEDHVASKRRDEESDAVDKECSIYEELLEVRRALDQDVQFDASSIVKGGYISKNIIVPRCGAVASKFPDDRLLKQYSDDVFDAASSIQIAFALHRAGRFGLCNCHIDWRTSPRVMHMCTHKACAVYRNSVELLRKEFTSECSTGLIVNGTVQSSHIDTFPTHEKCTIQAKIEPDKASLTRYRALKYLRQSRQTRLARVREIIQYLEKMKESHGKLCEIRRRLKSDKFLTRASRKATLDVAIKIEEELQEMDDIVTSYCTDACDNGRKEIKFFAVLFNTDLNAESTVNTPLDVSETEEEMFLLKALNKAKDVERIIPAPELPSWPHLYVEQLISKGLLHAKVESIKRYLPRNSSSKSKAKLMSAHHKKVGYPSKLKGVNKKVRINSTLDEPEVVKSKVPRNIPGLGKYVFENFEEGPPYINSTIIISWSGKLSKWFASVEDKWKNENKTLCIGFLQRVRHMLYGGTMYSTLKVHDTRLANIAKRGDPLDLMELLLCRSGLSLKPSTADASTITEESTVDSNEIDRLFGRHPFSIAAYNHFHGLDDISSNENICDHRIRVLRCNVFARLRLLRMPDKLSKDSLLLDMISLNDHSWIDHGGSMPTSADYQQMKLKHFYAMEIYSALITAASIEFNDMKRLLSSVYHGGHINRVVTIPSQPKQKGPVRKSLFAKKSRQPVKLKTEEVILKPILRIAIDDSIRIGSLFKSYRESVLEDSKQHFATVPSWMFPVYYWGQRTKQTNRAATFGGTSLTKDERVTEVAIRYINKLTDRANRRLRHEKEEAERQILMVHREYMKYEDVRSRVAQNISRMQATQDEERVRNSTWYKRIYNWTIGRKKISVFPPECSPEELQQQRDNVLKIEERLPACMRPPSMPILFQRYVRQEESFPTGKSCKQRYHSKADGSSSSKQTTWEHTDDCSTASTDFHVNKPRRGHVPSKCSHSLREMVVCGGMLNVVSVTRIVFDFENNPTGSVLVEPLAINSTSDSTELNVIQSSRVGFQNRILCDACDSFYAVSVSSSGRPLSETGFKLLRVYSPERELDSIDLLHRILFKLFQENRYNKPAVHDLVTRIQCLVRVRQASEVVRGKLVLHERK